MLALNMIFFIIAQMAGSATAEQAGEYVGQLPEVVVTAPRYEFEDEAWSGLMDTIFLTAPRVVVADVSPENATTSFMSHRLPIYSLILGIGVAIGAVFLSFRSIHKRPEHVPVSCTHNGCK
ncbi:MAG: hypothetical protein WBB67_01655 [bacterium]